MPDIDPKSKKSKILVFLPKKSCERPPSSRWMFDKEPWGPICNSCYQKLNRIGDKSSTLAQNLQQVKAYLQEQHAQPPVPFSAIVQASTADKAGSTSGGPVSPRQGSVSAPTVPAMSLPRSPQKVQQATHPLLHTILQPKPASPFFHGTSADALDGEGHHVPPMSGTAHQGPKLRPLSSLEDCQEPLGTFTEFYGSTPAKEPWSASKDPTAKWILFPFSPHMAKQGNTCTDGADHDSSPKAPRKRPACESPARAPDHEISHKPEGQAAHSRPSKMQRPSK
ncbi:hypothetical protein P389DRAFT_36785 [Cystobasidium minutum MCA 4210]|uniref:uncharacterized protein n=1 Tax=Cystobasidium minutum MCA 4210 TaxID=1397322 RepID=UPI0034CD2DA3|eukprot:jgi/Rhomi1/36785/CE36784_964